MNSEKEALKLVIEKLIKEKEHYILKRNTQWNKNNMNNIKRINTHSGHKVKIKENSNKKMKK